jgi:crotonobetainyl-CoA:carnitine CoA-transferase CaiB-like acyl-CoA transferase
MAAPLQGIKIVDMTSVIMGPYATQILADLGAEVIKIEPPSGDTMRAIGPMVNSGMGCLFLHTNRNKRSLSIDLKSEAGRRIIQRILKDTDVLISNIRPQAMQRLGLSYTDVKAIRPDIIQVEAYGFGQNGVYAGKPAYDDLIQGLVALPSLSTMAGAADPRYAPTLIADRVAGLNIANIVMAALIHKGRTGEGQHVEVPMFETLAQMVLADHMGGATFIPQRGPMGYARLLAQHRKPYQTADGYLCAVIYTDSHWRTFLTLTGDEQLLTDDPRFSSLQNRTEHIGELYALVAQRLTGRTTAQWLEALNAADIPAMPLHTPETLLQDAHLQSVGFFHETDHPTEGTLREMRMPSNWSTARRDHDTPVPRLGEHTTQVLQEYGYAPDEIQNLIDKNVVHQA